MSNLWRTMLVDQVRLSPTDVLDGALDQPILGLSGALEDAAVVVDLDKPMSEAAAVGAVSKVLACDRVVVGRCTKSPDTTTRTLAQAFDTTIASRHGTGVREFVSVDDPDAELATVFERFHENPYASVVASQVLRLSEHLPIRAALDVESLAYSTLLGAREFRRWLTARGPRPLPPRSPQEPVRIERNDTELRITLNRPERRNAYGAQVRDALVAALEFALMDPSIEKVLLNGGALTPETGHGVCDYAAF
ncbi:MAG: enoyl-CoA hydratase/isomerase family protein, partial [Rhodococcus sp. (in: high G+C Gram-positive bacteria)]